MKASIRSFTRRGWLVALLAGWALALWLTMGHLSSELRVGVAPHDSIQIADPGHTGGG